MSLEMVTDPGFRFTDREAARDDLAEILSILHRCRLTERRLRADDEIKPVSGSGPYFELTPTLRLELLKAAQQELQALRRQLTIPGVLWAAFARRHERAIWRVYLHGPRVRQSFHDGVCVAELLVAARRRATEQGMPEEPAGEKRFRPLPRRHLGLAIRVASAVAGTDDLIAGIPESARPQKSGGPWPSAHSAEPPAPAEPHDRLRWRPGSRRTVSWQAAYNTACLYAALAAARLAATQTLPEDERTAWEERVVVSLVRVVNNPNAEMERPYDTVSQDPDFSAIRSAPDQFPVFRKFLDDQRRMDYPEVDVTQAPWGLAD
jgi:hypothetical protein